MAVGNAEVRPTSLKPGDGRDTYARPTKNMFGMLKVIGRVELCLHKTVADRSSPYATLLRMSLGF